MDIQRLNEDACNHEETRAALKATNTNFGIMKAAIEKLITDLEQLKRACPRPT